MNAQSQTNDWILEVVRGAGAGKQYALGPGETTLGRGAGATLDLAPHEGDGPRKVETRHSAIERTARGTYAVRDLESSGGTFVNRQRILGGQARELIEGDVVQVGGVHLKLARRAVAAAPVAPTRNGPAPVAPPAPPPPVIPPAAAAAPPRGEFAFQVGGAGGVVCRSFDDLLAVSAQRWESLREELVSGRLAGFLIGIGRPDLVPDPNARGTPDERLDAWLGRLPSKAPARPELDVHPRAVVVRSLGGGGTTVQRVRVSNVGYRLLRGEPPRVEAGASSWLRVSSPWDRSGFVAIDSVEIPLEVDLPEGAEARAGSVTFASNGGSQAVRVEVQPHRAGEAEEAAFRAEPSGPSWWESIAALPADRRTAVLVGGAIGLRALVGAGDWLGIGASAARAPGLAGPAILLGALGLILGVRVARARGGSRDLIPVGFAGAFAGVLLASVLVAACRTVELAWGGVVGFIAGLAIWGGLGALAALAFGRLAPARAMLGLLLAAGMGMPAVQAQEGTEPAAEAPTAKEAVVEVRQVDEASFPEITVDFEVKARDGTPLLDAKSADFRVTESDQEMPILKFSPPRGAKEVRPTAIVLVLDRSGSMAEEGRMSGLKRSVARFVEEIPPGSEVAVVAFGAEVRVICPFTSRPDEVRSAVDELTPRGSTRFYDGIAEAASLLSGRQGRKAVLALTDGLDTDSRDANLDTVIESARRGGFPIHALGLGSQDEIAREDLERLAKETRGTYSTVRQVDQLRAIYEEIARGLKNSYSLVYRTDRTIPDGTLRPVKLFYSKSAQAAQGELYIPGMVAPSPVWPPLYLGLLAALGGAAAYLGRRTPRPS